LSPVKPQGASPQAQTDFYRATRKAFGKPRSAGGRPVTSGHIGHRFVTRNCSKASARIA